MGRMAPTAHVTGGLVRGASRDGVRAFLGVPYAAPATGRDRYRPPQPVRPWDGERDATRHGPTAAQAPYPPPMAAVLPNSVDPGEEYLNVDVWAPEQGEDLPVMVWIHGGAFVRGANSVPTYDGSAFARDGVVLVGVNYRLGVPGFGVLDGAPTNLGLRDQVAALEWVRDNAAAFGGDPGNVTVVGESAGGMSVATLMASPSARGLFHRAVVQSGGAASVCGPDDARRVTAAIADLLGVPPRADAFAALDPERVVEAQVTVGLEVQAAPDPERWGPSVLAGGLGIMSLFPVVDGDLVPEAPLDALAGGAATGVPLLLGTTREEFRLFLVPTGAADRMTWDDLAGTARRLGWPEGTVRTYAANRPGASPGDVACAVLTDAGFRVPTRRLAEAQYAAGGPVHAYELAWRTPVGGLGACHALDLAFVFDTVRCGTPMVGDGAPQHLADEMHRAWVGFVAGGDPGWESWSPGRRPVMTFDEASRVVEDPRAEELALWA